MAEKNCISNEQRRRQTAETLWLEYFNRFLYEKGIITEVEHNRMINMINSRKPAKI